MLKLEPIEYFLRVLPEGFLIIFAIYAFSKIKINKNKFIITSLISSVVFYLIRMLPINYGVHTILSMGFVMLMGVNFNKIELIKVIKSCLIYIITQFASEGVNIFIIQNILKENINEIFLNPISKILYGTPSLVIMFLIIGSYHIYTLKRCEVQDV